MVKKLFFNFNDCYVCFNMFMSFMYYWILFCYYEVRDIEKIYLLGCGGYLFMG